MKSGKPTKRKQSNNKTKPSQPNAAKVELKETDKRPRDARCLRIHRFLQAKKFPNARTMAIELGVNEKTVREDFDHMEFGLGLPIDYCYKKKGFYYTEEVTAFPTQLVTDSDLRTLAMIEQLLGCIKGMRLKKEIKRMFDLFTRGLPSSFAESRANWKKIVSVRFPNEARSVPAHLDIIAKAAASQQRIKAKYRKPGEPNFEERDLNPWHLLNLMGDWYLFAFDHERNAIRCFSLLRMKDIELTGQTFERPEDFDVGKHLEGSFLLQSPDGEYDVVIEASREVADFIREKKWPGEQAMEELAGGGVQLKLRLTSLVEVKRWLQQWGGRIVPLHPPKLQEMVIADAQAIICATQAAMRRGGEGVVSG
ncbi:MAG: helix-turn-helix transcriptional regulator [Limisphaerales bacterium]